jgi:hypothetical protein
MLLRPVSGKFRIQSDEQRDRRLQVSLLNRSFAAAIITRRFFSWQRGSNALTDPAHHRYCHAVADSAIAGHPGIQSLLSRAKKSACGYQGILQALALDWHKTSNGYALHDGRR